MILRFQEAFPSAFAQEGLEERDALVAEAQDLEREGALRIVWPKGTERFLPSEVRLGPEEVERAYGCATGYEALAIGLSALERHLGSMGEVADWAAAYFARVMEGLRAFDTRALGIAGRDRFKREWRDVRDALTAVAHLSVGSPGLERMVSERIYGDSKRLAQIRARIVALLLEADPSWDQVEAADHATVLAAYGVERKPALIPCAGRGVLRIDGRVIHLEDFRPAAYLPEAWTGALVEAMRERGLARILTIENEYPFLSYVWDRTDADELVVYVAGFPTPALVRALATIREATGAELRHWGDADAGGLRIWWYLRSRLGPVALFRTTAAWLRTEGHAGRPLTNDERAALHRLRAQIEKSGATGGDVDEALALIEALHSVGRKLEQEHGLSSGTPLAE